MYLLIQPLNLSLKQTFNHTTEAYDENTYGQTQLKVRTFQTHYSETVYDILTIRTCVVHDYDL